MSEVIIVAGGASIAEGVSLGLWERIRDRNVWSVNYSFRMMGFLPKREVWVDYAFFENNLKDIEALWKQGVKLVSKKNNRYCQINHYLGEAITQYEETRVPVGFKGVHALREPSPMLFSGVQGLVGFFALSLAMAEGYKTIYLLGMDYGTVGHTDKFTHFYQNKIQVFSTGVGNTEVYLKADGSPKKEVEDFGLYQKEAEANGVTIWNVSLRSRISAFPKISYETFFEKLAGTI